MSWYRIGALVVTSLAALFTLVGAGYAAYLSKVADKPIKFILGFFTFFAAVVGSLFSILCLLFVIGI